MCTYDPASSTTRMRRRPSHAKVLGAVWVDMLYMVLLVAVVMILMKVLGDLGYDATVPIGVLVGGIVLLFIKIFCDSVADVHRATTQHQSTAAPHGVWPPTPPSPTEGTLPRDLGRILNFVTPMLLTMLLMMFIGGFRDQVAANFIVNPGP